MEEERKKEKRKKENSIELQKPNAEADVYNNSKKNVRGKKKRKKLRRLIRFHSVNEINKYNKEGEVKKNQKILQNKSKHKNNKCFS